jgi:regulator of protease activity HflC (stomatin/prohibitin superfamily)
MRTALHLRSRAAIIASAVLLVALLALAPFASAAAAVPVSTPASGKCPTGLSGLGTAASPCLIGNATDLYKAMEGINADTTHLGAAIDDYKLTADIDATTYSAGTAGTASTFGATENWSGIDYFSGTFDGDGHTISNLNYTSDAYLSSLPAATAAAGLNLGLFRVLNGATVENLGLHNVRGVSATSNAAVGGVSVWSFDSTVSGVSLTEPTLSDTAGGGACWLGGLVGLAYANTYADDGSAVSDGGNSVFTNNLVSGGTLVDANRTGGILGQATGPTTVADNWVNTAFSNPLHPVAGAGGQSNLSFYVIGGLVGEVGTTYMTSGGATAAGVAMTDNVIQGSLKGSATDHRSFEDANFASATVGYATIEGHVAVTSAPNASNWSSTNNLVSSTFVYTNATGSGLPGADGISVSPATLETEATYAGTATGQSDATTGATYDQLGWSFGGGGSSATSGWAWTGTSPVPAVTPTITVANDPIAFLAGAAPSQAAVEAAAGATTNFGTITVEDAGVEWSKPGSYTATLTATSGGLTSSRQLTIIVVSGTVPVAHSTGGLEASASAPSTAEVLKALGAVLPQGDGGTLAVSYPAGEPAWNTPGSYAVEVVDNGGSDGLAPTTAAIAVVAQPTVTVTNSTVSFRHGVPVAGHEVLTLVEPHATYSAGDSGIVTADLSGLGAEVGEYTVNITATDVYGIASAPTPVTVAIADGKILLGHATAVFQVTTTEPTEAAILAALAPVMPPDTTGHPTLSGFTAADFETAGSFSVTVSDSDAADEVGPATAEIEVVGVPAIVDSASTVYFNTAEPPTAAEVIAAAGAQVTAQGLPAPGSTLEATLPAGCGTAAGSCKATLVGIDSYGFTTAPVEVTVEVSAATVSVAHSTTFFGASAAEPSQAMLVSNLGATVNASTNGGQPVVDTSGVRWDVAGTYTVTVGDNAAHDAAPTVQASIEIVPLPVVTVPTTTIFLPASSADPLSEAALLANAGAELTDGSGNAVSGTITADASAVNGTVAGTYTATIEGTDDFGIESAPLTITVVIYSEVANPTEESALEEEAQHATEAKQQAEEALHAAEAKATEEAKHGAEATQRAEAAEKAAEAAKHAAEEAEKRAATATANTPGGAKPANPSGGGQPPKPELVGLSATTGQVRGGVTVTEKGTLTATATSGKLKVGSVQVKVTNGKTVALKLALSKAAKAQLAQHNLKITLKVTFKNAAGETSTVTKTVTVDRAPA